MSYCGFINVFFIFMMPITNEDFSAALCQIRGIVSTQDLAPYDDLNNRFSCAAKE